jgi:hypothetical protein
VTQTKERAYILEATAAAEQVAANAMGKATRQEPRPRSLMEVANTLPDRALAQAVNSRITADAVMLSAKSTLWRLTGGPAG